MGTSPSKEELLYNEVQNGNHDAVKSLNRDGASLEWVDKDGRTPLILACSRCELLDMTITLLNLGANMKAYSSGTHGGYPLHHAAKKGLDKTVTLLLSRGANPLVVNDDGQTPLDMARSRGHVAVVRLLEDELCLFSGTLRELSGPGILESLAPNFMIRKIWAVVLPIKPKSRIPEYELALYEPPKLNLWNGVRPSSAHPAGLCNVAQPQALIPLAKAEIEEPNFTLADPVVCIADKKTKYRFYSEHKGNGDQLERFYKACKGLSQVGSAHVNDHYQVDGIVEFGSADANSGCPVAGVRSSQQGNTSQRHPSKLQKPSRKLPSSIQPILQSVSAPSCGQVRRVKTSKSTAEPISEDLAFALALDESIKTAIAEGIIVSSEVTSVSCASKYLTRVTSDSTRGRQFFSSQHKRNKTTRRAKQSMPQWSAAARFTSDSSQEFSDAPTAPPSAPPLQGFSFATNNASSNGDTKKPDGACAVCWDAPAEGACIPCGHLAGCMDCLTKVKTMKWGCPVCRGVIDQVVRVYTV